MLTYSIFRNRSYFLGRDWFDVGREGRTLHGNEEMQGTVVDPVLARPAKRCVVPYLSRTQYNFRFLLFDFYLIESILYLIFIILHEIFQLCSKINKYSN